ncbi:MAG TPA: MucR family transcriptional regulator [Candidatus Binatia bacterium]|nr:MucR family transcriptional regulator [Candidatus Binatia bacterium]
MEAVREDGVVCLDCGALRKALGSHLFFAHEMAIGDYKAKWGYNRQTGLVAPSTAEKLRQIAVARDLGANGSGRVLEIARKARAAASLTKRFEARTNHGKTLKARYANGWQPSRHRKVNDETLRILGKEGHTCREIAEKTGLSRDQARSRLRNLGLFPPLRPRRKIGTQQILALRAAGLWPSDIAARLGLSRHAVLKRLWELRKKGVHVPRPKTPRPITRRRVTDDEFLALVAKGLKPAAIAARVGMKKGSVLTRAVLLRRRGLLKGKRTW